MIGEIEIGGVFVPALLAWVVIAVALSVPLRWAISRMGLYRYIWHPGLFDLSVLVILVGAVAAAADRLGSP
jgi:hypothetical protein